MVKKYCLTLMASLLLVGGMTSPVMAQTTLDLLHKVPFQISAYPESKAFPDKFTTSDEVVGILNKTPNLLVHMEALRRGYFDLAPSEQEALVKVLHARYFSNENDTIKFFDNGYAQLVYKSNKTGLFFLRKANDKIKNQFSNLAYALAQADADINIEKASPDVMTFRKLDVTYKLSDAVDYDAKSHQPGFWPAFLSVLTQLKAIGPFANFTNTDFSSKYVPFGSDVALVNAGKVQVATSESTALPPLPGADSSIAQTASCDTSVTAPSTGVNWEKLIRSTDLHLGDGLNGSKVNFFPTEKPNSFRVIALDPNKQTLANFSSPVAPYIVEDIDGDGVDELVIRQYLESPENPVIVYRFNKRCGFQLDKTVSRYFQ
ncbi:MAG: hypothetical protein K2X66_12470 [Cyanobacteria bacterium]|nr:hypothetical protein [Cyanobacteriota bacterium]